MEMSGMIIEHRDMSCQEWLLNIGTGQEWLLNIGIGQEWLLTWRTRVMSGMIIKHM